MRGFFGFLLFTSLGAAGGWATVATEGYYRDPALSGETVVFVAEGDLWTVDVRGGAARRLTSHPGDEGSPAVSPDGSTLAFVATYEGPAEVYTMPLAGGLPTRRTFGATRARVAGFHPDGRLAYSTTRYAGLPDPQLVLLDTAAEDAPETRVPLAQAADGDWSAAGDVLYFTRYRFQGSHTRRYRGGTAQSIWSWRPGEEARPLTADFPGTSKRPMAWRERVYFASDRDDVMNLWSMDVRGGDLRQHTFHRRYEVKEPYLHDGRIVYRHGADLRLYDTRSREDRKIPVTLVSDLDQTRESWIEDPVAYVEYAHLSPDGDRLLLTARGRVFSFPAEDGRRVELAREPGVRHRAARFLPDGETVLTLSDESGEVELWTRPADGTGEAKRLTEGGDVLRWEGVASPDGELIAHRDKNNRLFILEVDSGRDRKIDENPLGGASGLAWSPDSRYLAYSMPDENTFERIKIHDVGRRETYFATTDRFDSDSPAWSPDGRWLYFLSDRNLTTRVGSPWGSYQPEPFMDKKTRIFQLALVPGIRSDWVPPSELDASEDDDADADDENSEGDVRIEREGLLERLVRVPLPPGNHFALRVTKDALFWLDRPVGETSSTLMAAAVENREAEAVTVAEDVRDYELSEDRKKLLLRKGNTFHILDAAAKKADLKDTAVSLADWTFSVDPREEWRQMFREAWRLERDYFYDRNMHGVDWPAIHDKYEPLLARVTTRAELSDLIAQMVAELSALHIFVRGGDLRDGPDEIAPATLGARLVRDPAAGGYRVERIWGSDPDAPERRSPLVAPGVDVREGDVLVSLDGTPTLEVAPGAALRNRAGRQVLLEIRPRGAKQTRRAIVTPLTLAEDADLRYHEWEWTRRLAVEDAGEGELGYVHLRAMGRRNWTEWATHYYPVYNRKGLIVDVRHNRGGNIDSWILGRLLRRPWHHWNQRTGGAPFWNMQYSFPGHVVVLCDAFTASDGEAFAEGARRLGIATVIGTRTWGGEIWLTSSNRLLDRGIATAAEFGVFSPEGEWLIEGHGVDPDIVVDNLPHETFEGRDAQLEAAIEYLQRKLVEEPVVLPSVPPFPDKSGR